MKKISKIIKYLLIILSIVMIILIILNIKEKMSKPKYEISQPSDYNEVISTIKTLKYKNTEILKVFNGDLPVSTITTKLKEVFCEKIPQLVEDTKDLSKQELEEYFEKNERDILVSLRINNSQSFLNMLEKYENIAADLKTEYDYIEFTKDNDIFGKIVYTNKQEIEFEIQGKYSTNIFLEF